MTTIEKYKFGSTGFVRLDEKTATKYFYLHDLQWISEFMILSYLKPFNLNNILLYEETCVEEYKGPNDHQEAEYFTMTFDLYRGDMSTIKIYNDSDFIQFMLDILSAMSFLHSKGILHRDIKPHNILMNSNGRYALCDFTHSFIMLSSNLKIMRESVYTWPYRPPEIYCMEDDDVNNYYDSSADIWAFGMTLAEIFTGKNFGTDICKTEDRVKLLFTDTKSTSDTIKNYLSKPRYFKYGKQYSQWISLMLKQDACDRVTAKSLFNEIIKFAEEHDIKYSMPVNEIGECNIAFDISKYKIYDATSDEEQLYKKCCGVYNDIININMYCDGQIVSGLFKFLISKQFINYDNYNHICKGIYILLSVSLFDGFVKPKQQKWNAEHAVVDVISFICKAGINITAFLDWLK